MHTERNDDPITQVVRSFNIEVIQHGRRDAFDALMAPDFINRTAPPGAPSGPESLWHTLLGIAATGRPIAIDVIDIVRVQDGRYAEHWGINTLPAVLASLRAAS